MADLFPKNEQTRGSYKSKAAKPTAKPEGPVFGTPEEAVAELERRHGPASALWKYPDAHGELVGIVVRWDGPQGKSIRPIARYPDGWRIAGMPDPRPLYQLPKLAERKLVVVVEGEKASDAATALGYVATTSPHGAQSPGKADWSPLAGKEVLILPDHDDAGEKYAEAVAKLLMALSPAPTIRVLRLPALEDGEDIVDFIAKRREDAKDDDAIRQEIDDLAKHAKVVEKPAAQTAGETAFPASDGENIETLAMPEPKPWPKLDPAARYGVIGEILTTVEPHSESDPAAILIQSLAAFGNAVGRSPFVQVESDRHHCNLFACLVGQSSKGRKGTSRGRVLALMKMADEGWSAKCVASGLSSGEGLIWEVRDAIEKQEPVKERGRVTGYQMVQTDPGIDDKRLLIEEGEFAKVLRVMQREGNSLSPVIRQCWDTGNLRSLTKISPARATDAHISISAHITAEELGALMDHTDAFNGFANRFLWFCVRRARMLPDGGCAVSLEPLGARLADALSFAKHVERMTRDGGASDLWHAVYPELTAERFGLYGAVTGRAEAQVLRLSMLYALLDGSCIIDANHLTAALAVWRYADDSARWIFGDIAVDPLAEPILAFLRDRPQGATRTDLHRAFSNNAKAAKILASLARLRDQNRVHAVKEKTGRRGAPAERWFHGPRPNEKNETNE